MTHSSTDALVYVLNSTKFIVYLYLANKNKLTMVVWGVYSSTQLTCINSDLSTITLQPKYNVKHVSLGQ